MQDTEDIRRCFIYVKHVVRSAILLLYGEPSSFISLLLLHKLCGFIFIISFSDVVFYCVQNVSELDL